MTTEARSTSIAARRCRATSADRRSARASSSDATSSGVRDVSPPSGPEPYSLRRGGLAQREGREHEPCPRAQAPPCGPAVRGRAQPGRPAWVADPRSEERRVGKSVDLGGRRISKKKK